jgi:hypothetical protein
MSSCVVLHTTVASSQIVEVAQRKILTALGGKKVAVELIDGTDPEMKELRTKLFGVSGITGKYPQVFIKVSATLL